MNADQRLDAVDLGVPINPTVRPHTIKRYPFSKPTSKKLKYHRIPRILKTSRAGPATSAQFLCMYNERTSSRRYRLIPPDRSTSRTALRLSTLLPHGQWNTLIITYRARVIDSELNRVDPQPPQAASTCSAPDCCPGKSTNAIELGNPS